MMGKSSGTTMQTKSSLTKDQQTISSLIAGKLQQGLATPLAQYNGEQVAALTPEMQQAQELLKSYNPGQYDKQISGIIQESLSGKPSYSVDKQATTDYFQKGLMAPMLREYQNTVAPRINDQFAAAGSLFSTRRGEAQSNALSNITSNATSELAKAVQSNQALEASLAESAKNRQYQGIGLASQMENLPLTRSQALVSASNPFQQYAQQKASVQYADWQRNQAENNPWLQYGLSFTGQSQMIGYQQASGSSGIGGASGGLAGLGIGYMAGGPLGALIGGTAGYGVGNAF